MIKLLTFCFFLLSCGSKIEYKDLSLPKDQLNVQNFELLSFNPQIEMMIIFLWPSDLGPENEKEVIGIISTSRKISEDKDLYLNNLYRLNSEYNLKSCDCHSFGICEEGIDMDDDIMLECQNISEQQESNNLILANLTLDHDIIKKKLSAIGATNIDVGVDDDDLDVGTYDITSKVITLNKFVYRGLNSSVEFYVIPYAAQSIKARFSITVNDEIITGDLGVSSKKHNVIFSGEIETSNGQRGLIYWEHLK